MSDTPLWLDGCLLLVDEVHLRAGDLLHRVSLRTGRTVTERAPW